jgi:hypothetical protein
MAQEERLLPDVEFPLNKDDDRSVKTLGSVIPETNARCTGSNETRCGGELRPRICQYSDSVAFVEWRQFGLYTPFNVIVY